eukprot:12402686-Karenia_brevis.AAC.1
MAEKGMVSIGGWLVTESGCTQDSKWFHLEVSEDTLPVVYQKGKSQAFRYIATLELLGTLCGMQAFVWNSEQQDQSAEATCFRLAKTALHAASHVLRLNGAVDGHGPPGRRHGAALETQNRKSARI